METFSALLALCEGNPPVTDGFSMTKASDAELWCVLWSLPEQTVVQTINTPVFGTTSRLLWRHCKGNIIVDRYQCRHRDRTSAGQWGDITPSANNGWNRHRHRANIWYWTDTWPTSKRPTLEMLLCYHILIYILSNIYSNRILKYIRVCIITTLLYDIVIVSYLCDKWI